MIALKKYGKSRLLFSETDSLMYEIKAKDFTKSLVKTKKMFDLSNYWTKPNDGSNKLVVGKMKNEAAGVPIKGLNLLNNLSDWKQKYIHSW